MPRLMQNANDSHLALAQSVMNVVGIPGQNQLLCPDIMAATVRLEAAGIALSGGPMRLGPGMQAIFVRDPDRNVIELHQRG
jgi:catechol 2,3-dioxygenase-like lactoylglutathione lyase family enzyme